MPVIKPVLLVLLAQGPRLLGLGVSGWQHLWNQDWCLRAVLLEAVLEAVFLSLEPELSSHSRRQVLLHGQAIKVSHREVIKEAIKVRRMHTENRHTHISTWTRTTVLIVLQWKAEDNKPGGENRLRVETYMADLST